MKIIGYDPNISIESAWQLPKEVEKADDLKYLLSNSDYVSLHVPLVDETKNLISYCGLDWNEACLKPQENKKIVATASLSQIRSPIYKSSVKKWKNFEAQLKELKQKID